MKSITAAAVLVPTLLLLSGCQILVPGANKSPEGDLGIPETEIVVPQIQSEFLEGDTLWDFAERTTGSGYNWQKIMELNEIPDEKDIDAGVVLLVPPELAVESLRSN